MRESLRTELECLDTGRREGGRKGEREGEERGQAGEGKEGERKREGEKVRRKGRAGHLSFKYTMPVYTCPYMSTLYVNHVGKRNTILMDDRIVNS